MYLQLLKKKRFTAMKKMFPRCHIEAAKGCPESNIEYCSKEKVVHRKGVPTQKTKAAVGSMVEDMLNRMPARELHEKYGDRYMLHHKKAKIVAEKLMFEDMMKAKKESKVEITLRPWQQEAWDKLQGQDDRQILFVVDLIGNQGKSRLAMWLKTYHDALLLGHTRFVDAAFYYQQQNRYVIFDLTRSSEGFVNYGCMEAFKNETVLSTKYECMDKFADCKVMVLTNYEPDMTKLSADRYDIMRLQKETVQGDQWNGFFNE